MSCGLVVDIPRTTTDGLPQRTPSLPSTAFLKLFDRRHAPRFRDDFCVQPYAQGMEEACVKFVQSGEADRFLSRLKTDSDLAEKEGGDWDDAECEAYLASEAMQLRNTEMAIYDVLKPLQGKQIPRVLSGVTLDIDPRSHANVTASNGAGAVAVAASHPTPSSAEPNYVFHVHGLLLEYLEGFTMAELVKHAPQSAWQNVVDQAVEIVRKLDEYNILNEDVRPENFMVVKTSQEQGGTKHHDCTSCAASGYHVYMIDLAMCRKRGEDESDSEWGRDKCDQDEEGAVGYVMRTILAREKFMLDFVNSRQYRGFAKYET
ncbi:uncharacterized protein B0I36DRAFT_297556 [Microdochium trichocladiopsis]|uniref:Protein kinase domain-containing protein n=1 Tax=Microdochium trichocladiopsis TaxID=1682393 RepID=A0A9P8XX61_9PEZI|nr:uncharacterized protein B0I36DRAFT_297556 [Microdochium trichocladiopsis]KAH7018088.1 hypothetical protein B0I36DRAFT_297556 [Microdochium trichocladiopsis]